MAGLADPLQVGEVPLGAAPAQRDNVVDLGREAPVADFADRIPSEDLLAGRLPPLAVVEPNPRAALAVGPALSLPLALVLASMRSAAGSAELAKLGQPATAPPT
jgi:hypothetical protein